MKLNFSSSSQDGLALKFASVIIVKSFMLFLVSLHPLAFQHAPPVCQAVKDVVWTAVGVSRLSLLFSAACELIKRLC